MKILNRLLTFVVLIGLTTSCFDDYKLPYPEFEEGASLRPLPSPWTARPLFSLANPTAPFILDISSFNGDDLEKVDVYVSYLANTAVPAAAGTGTYANFLAPLTSGGWIPEVPASGTAPITINYTRYNQLITGVSATGVAFTAMPRTLFKTLNGAEITGNLSFTLADLATATGTTLPASVPASTTFANTQGQPAFILIFEVTKKDGGVYNYLNAGPGVTANPATGRVAARFFTGTDVLGNPVTNKAYNLILSGEEGSPFVPGVSIRIAP